MSDDALFERMDAGIQALDKPSGRGNNFDLERRLIALETKIDTLIPTLATSADMAEVRADIKGWMLQTVIAIIGAMLAAIFGVAQLMKPAPTPSPPPPQASMPPIIINVPAAPAPAAPAQK